MAVADFIQSKGTAHMKPGTAIQEFRAVADQFYDPPPLKVYIDDLWIGNPAPAATQV